MEDNWLPGWLQAAGYDTYLVGKVGGHWAGGRGRGCSGLRAGSCGTFSMDRVGVSLGS